MYSTGVFASLPGMRGQGHLYRLVRDEGGTRGAAWREVVLLGAFVDRVTVVSGRKPWCFLAGGPDGQGHRDERPGPWAFSSPAGSGHGQGHRFAAGRLLARTGSHSVRRGHPNIRAYPPHQLRHRRPYRLGTTAVRFPWVESLKNQSHGFGDGSGGCL